MKLKKD
jgi:sodium/potassium-transporting ATPase subunit alpha